MTWSALEERNESQLKSSVYLPNRISIMTETFRWRLNAECSNDFSDTLSKISIDNLFEIFNGGIFDD